jgi:hypothetical protein
MERHVGRSVTLLDVADDLSQRTTPAVLLSAQGPVYQVGDQVLLYHQGRVLLPSLPPDLVPSPRLEVDLESASAGSQEIELAYLAEGLSWTADYVLVVAADEKIADLSGWVTVDNRTGADFENAGLQLMAGQLNRVAPPHVMQVRKTMAMREEAAMDASAAPGFAQEGVSEYHLYTLDRPVTLGDQESRQLALFDAAGVPVTRKLTLEGQEWWYRSQHGPLAENRRVAVVLEVPNTEKGNLGRPLPAGTVRVYQRDRSGAAQIAGEAAISHTPKDETLRLSIGEAFDVVADQKQTEYRSLSPRQSESAYEISLRNRKDEDVVVTVREPVGGDWRVLDSSHPARKADARTIEFDVPVPAGKEVKLTYRVRVTW